MAKAVTAKYVLKAVLSISIAVFLAVIEELNRKIMAKVSKLLTLLKLISDTRSSVDYYSGELQYNDELGGSGTTGASHILMMYGTSPCPVSVPIEKVIGSIKRRLAVMEYGEYEEREENRGCVVCWERIEKRDEIREMANCKHVLFHRKCLDRWLDEGHITCPLCRSSLITTNTHNNINITNDHHDHHDHDHDHEETEMDDIYC